MSEFGPDSIMWRVNRERVVLLSGAAAAVLQVAHPQVARGVAAHSNFQEDGMGRLRRTLDSVYAVAFGTREEAEAVRRQVATAHARVKGAGYSAFDPDAQLWVLATLIMGSVTMFRRFVGELSGQDLEKFLQEQKCFAGYFGLPPEKIPSDWSDFESYWEKMLHGDFLGSDPACARVAHAVLTPAKPRWMVPLHSLFAALTAELITPALAHRLQLPVSRIRKPVWRMLDIFLPRLLPLLPSRARFAPAYLAARADARPPSPDSGI